MIIRRFSARACLTVSSCLAALCIPHQGLAQEASVEEAAADTTPDSAIIVTGSRIKRDGYNAPTPETVLSAEAIAIAAPANLADFVNTLPAVAPTSTPRTATINASSGSAGSNFLNLRGLGATRTLVLLDGRRVVGANAEGTVDANTLPTALISRVDIVTGGASAAYGSDAVSGVANFILDTRFTGVKGVVQSGITTYGDGFNWKAELSAGTSFASGRGHILVSGSYADSKGVTEIGDRKWFKSQKIVANPLFAAGNGQPTLVSAENVYISNASFGGLITNGVLRGTVFGQGGAYRPFVYGTPAGSTYMIGGEFNDMAQLYQLEIPVEQASVFGRISYDVSDAFKLFAEATYSKSIADSHSVLNFNFGNLTIQRDNAFLPDELRQRLQAAGQTSFSYGIMPADMGRLNAHNVRELQRYVLGAEGDIGGGWSYSIYGQLGRTHVDVDLRNVQNNANFRRAIDAVRNSSGQIVCRVNLATISDPGCIPYNPFGIGVNAGPVLEYVTGTSQLRQQIDQKVAVASIQGEPFSTWAGPVSVVFGAEYRREAIDSQVDAVSQASGYLAGNYKPTIGHYTVKELFAETIVPLADGLPFLERLELNGAFRHTDYSTSGGVNTWKIGGTWSPVDDIRFRATYSQDIRAPNLSELFQGGITSAGQTVLDRATGQQTTGITGITIGNRNLAPEKAKSFTVGAVFTPSFLRGLSLSVDYYDIRIRNAIVTASTQSVVDRCNDGNISFCPDVVRNAAGVITTVFRLPRNFASERARGLDIEGSFNKDLSDWASGLSGRLNLRVLATHYISRTLDDGVSIDQSVGENSGSLPNWRIQSSIGYDSETFGAQVTARSVSGGVFDKRYTSATLADNHIPGATYFDLALIFKLRDLGGSGEFFLNVDNVFNRDPVNVPPQGQQFAIAGVNATLYDTLGREFRAGVRFRF